MATLEVEIQAALIAVPGMTAIIGVPPNDRIWSVQAPQNVTYPCIVITVISERDEGRAMGVDGGSYRSQLQVDIYAKTFAKLDGAIPVRDLVRTGLKRLRTGAIKDSFEENGGMRSFVTDPDLCRITMEYTIWHS
jgi:hypothetical protein